MPLTPTDVDAAVPVGGTPSRALTNSALKQLITDIADVGVGIGVGTVNTFADLPVPSTVTGQRWWVLQSTGVWLVNRRTKGAYYSDGTAWSYLGDFPVTAAEVGFVPSGGIAAGDVQAALQELDTEKAGTATFTSSTAGLVPASGGGTTNFLRADGTFASPGGGGASDPITLANPPVVAPAAGTFSLGAQSLGGLAVPSITSGSGWTQSVQPLLGRGRTTGYLAGNSATVMDRFPGGPPTLTVLGTPTSRTPASTNYVTRQPRIGWVSAATAAAFAGVYNGTAASRFAFMSNGTGLGGFLYIARFGVTDAATVAGARMFVGLSNATGAPTNVEPSTELNCIGIAQLSTSSNLHIVHGGTTAQAPIDLGVNFPADTLGVDFYELVLFSSATNNTQVGYQVTRLNTGQVTSGTLPNPTPGTTMPAANLSLGVRNWRTNNATLLAVAIDISSILLHVDL